LILDITAPEVTLNGVENNGTVDGKVTITDISEEGTIEVYKDGQKIDYNLGDELSEYGSYEVVIKDNLGNTRTYNFTLKYQINGWAIALIVLASLATIGALTTIVIKRKKIFKGKTK